MTFPIKILIADDKSEICDSLEENVILVAKKFGIDKSQLQISKAFTEHAYDHGKTLIKDGLKPDICIFDLIFNGHTGIQLYQFLSSHLNTRIPLCIYTGVEKTYEARKNAEVLSSESQGAVNIVAKPNIHLLLEWLEDVLEYKFKQVKNEIDQDPFDLL